ncbi:MAG: hypothetical protein QOK42_1183 [Frankiaceae bacterium]|jgi:PPOX class probable F420-dependent enzyme|nr:hypothetical protein [Frankiaceae bacterium]
MADQLPQRLKDWIDAKVFAQLATIEPDGQPQLSTMWVGYDGDDILMSTVVGRRKEQNMRRDPRVTVLVNNPATQYGYVEVRGTATLTEEGGRDLIDQFSETYRGVRPYPQDREGAVRVVVRITASRVRDYG